MFAIVNRIAVEKSSITVKENIRNFLLNRERSNFKFRCYIFLLTKALQSLLNTKGTSIDKQKKN